MFQDMKVKFEMTTRQKTVLGCLQAAQTYDFLLDIAIDELSQHMPPVEYRTILKYYLMVSLFPIDEVCPLCPKTCMNTYGEHVIHVSSFMTLSTKMTLLGMSFLIYSCGHEYISEEGDVCELPDLSTR